MGTFSSLSICQTVQIENHPEDNSTEAWEADANYRGPAVLYCVLVLDFKDGNEEELKERWF